MTIIATVTRNLPATIRPRPRGEAGGRPPSQQGLLLERARPSRSTAAVSCSSRPPFAVVELPRGCCCSLPSRAVAEEHLDVAFIRHGPFCSQHFPSAGVVTPR